MYIVIGTAPTVDTSVAVGPFRSLQRADVAYDEMVAKGWNAETCPLFSVREIETVASWSEA